MKQILKNKTALIIGNGSKFIDAITKQFIHQGAQAVFCLDVPNQNKRKPLTEIEAEILQNGQLEKFKFPDIFHYIKNKFQSLDVVVNDLNCISLKDVQAQNVKYHYKDYDLGIEIICYCMDKIFEIMIKNKTAGSIINILPSFGNTKSIDKEKNIIYRGALSSLSKHWAVTFGRNNMRVNAISPGYILDESYSIEDQINETVYLKRCGSINEVVNVVTFLASEEANYVTGSIIKVDGGKIM